MSFEWKKANGTLALLHIAADGTEKLVDFHDVSQYVASLHASERQSPLPPFPLDEAAAEAAGDPAIKAAADSYPDALRAAVTAALSRAEACMLAAGAAADSADAALAGTAKALRELRDLAALIAPKEPNPAPVDDGRAPNDFDKKAGEGDAPFPLPL